MSFILLPAASALPPVLFLPGWGFDGRLVSVFSLFPGRSLILPQAFVDPFTAVETLPEFLRRQRARVAVVGWSMGAQLGIDLTMTHPELVDSLTLVAMRRQWPAGEIAVIKQALARDRDGFLREFYRKCFLGYRDAYRRFVADLEAGYLSGLDGRILAAGLDYLERFRLPGRLADGIPLLALHGGRDVVAPVAEMACLPGMAREVMPHAGHMVLLDRSR